MARVLVVDDEEDIREGLAARLLRDGHAVHLAAGVKEAMDVMEAFVPDVLVTDFRMPPYTGEDLLCAVAALHPAVRRILYTGCSDEETQHARQVAHVVLRKGGDLREVSEAIQSCLESRHAC